MNLTFVTLKMKMVLFQDLAGKLMHNQHQFFSNRQEISSIKKMSNFLTIILGDFHYARVKYLASEYLKHVPSQWENVPNRRETALTCASKK